MVKQLDTAIALSEFNLVTCHAVRSSSLDFSASDLLAVSHGFSKIPVAKQFAWALLACDYSPERFFS